MSDIINYKCPSCSMPLVYKGETGRFSCEYCGGAFSLEEIKDASTDASQPAFDWGDYKKAVSQEVLSGTVSYSCKQCGAEVVTDAETAATRCPYCDNVMILDEKLKGLIRPNAVIPFKINGEGLKNAVSLYCRGKRLLPKSFLPNHRIEEIKGVYVPYWLYDCHADGVATIETTRRRSWSDNDYDYEETTYYTVDAAGDMDFKDIAVDGSVKMDDALMDSVGPFDFSELTEFKPGYLSGYLASRFDDDADSCLPRVNKRVASTVSSVLCSAVSGGYDSATVRWSDTKLEDTSVRYVMLPIYLINCRYNGELYPFAVNGQTGKVIGNLPVSGGKAAAWFFGIWAAFAALGAVLALLV